MRVTNILQIGDSPKLATWLEYECPATIVIHRVDNLCEAQQHLAASGDAPPTVILLPEERPGLWTNAMLRDLRRAAPLARLIRVSGSWCEGQARSGTPPHGCPAIPMHSWPVWIERQLAASAAGETCHWALPQTSLPEEQLLESLPAKANEPHPALDRTIAVLADRVSSAGAWTGLCQAFGYRTCILPLQAPDRAGDSAIARGPQEENRFDAILWDTDPRRLSDQPLLDSLIRRSAGAPIVALAGFPRAEDIAEARSAGIAAVWAKPLSAVDLRWQLEQLLASSTG